MYSRQKTQKPKRRKKNAQQRKRQRKQLQNMFKAKQLLLRSVQCITHFFPTFFEDLDTLSDFRKLPYYETRELVFACIHMFMLKHGSRNQANEASESGSYAKNFQKLFNMELAHGDTINRFMKQCSTEELEVIKKKMLQKLIENKVLRKYLYNGFYMIAVDATKVYSYKHEPYDSCPKQIKDEKTTWYAYVLEAKIICSNGFALSIASQWIENEENYDKQDCELKAFKRLSEKLKKDYPHLPICIVADGLYPNDSVFTICKEKNWSFIITLKDGNLKSLQKTIDKRVDNRKFKATKTTRKKVKQHGEIKTIENHYMFAENLTYLTHKLNWIFCNEIITEKGVETNTVFTHVTNMPIGTQSVIMLSQLGRYRWKIENEGFNCQKNNGYELCHKYSRKSFTAIKNYYQCLQIAHIINQLAFKSEVIQTMYAGKKTLLFFAKATLSFMLEGILDIAEITQTLSKRCQFRY